MWLDWPYKLHTGASANRGKKGPVNGEVKPVLLYDLSKDPNETTDLATQQPERVAEMTAALAAWRTSVGKSLAGADYGGPLKETAPAPRAPKKEKKKRPGP